MASTAPPQEIKVVFTPCKCGCGEMIPPEPVRQFIDEHHRDRYYNRLRPRKTERRIRHK